MYTFSEKSGLCSSPQSGNVVSGPETAGSGGDSSGEDDSDDEDERPTDDNHYEVYIM